MSPEAESLTFRECEALTSIMLWVRTYDVANEARDADTVTWARREIAFEMLKLRPSAAFSLVTAGPLMPAGGSPTEDPQQNGDER